MNRRATYQKPKVQYLPMRADVGTLVALVAIAVGGALGVLDAYLPLGGHP